ncbi:uncharacterized protein EAF02_002098 [Botrytis sinoallii]|uniref:uncharacterized protein n=1 Tax=Botrytis sinoallii TaxID=1463999 RepID=UPI001902990B|nr:uncharacterized protein EAF02_002098 [Botrytis sinoallii]KAF7889683.1 hypothetical protein EAF02_002098 [Botrytis sinoallii]
MADKAQDEAEGVALNPSSGEGAAPKENVRGGKPGIWQSGKNCVSYFSTLSVFTITTLLMIPGLALACYHQRALQLLTLTTTSTPGKISGGLNATNGGGDNLTHKIYLWYYCISGVAAGAGNLVNITDSCHQSRQALTYHILPSLNSTFKPPLPGYDASGPIMAINDLIQNYAYPAFASYVAAIFLLIIFSSFFIWWFGATATPHKETLMLVLSIFTGCFATLAALQTYLCYQTIYILNRTMEHSKSTLNISITPGFSYLIIIHLFWIILLLNIFIIPISTCIKRRRAKRQLKALETDAHELKENETLNGNTKVCSTPDEPADSESSDDDYNMPPRGAPQYGVPTYPHPGMQDQGYYGHGYGAQMPMPMSLSDPMQDSMYPPQSAKRKNKEKREQERDTASL